MIDGAAGPARNPFFLARSGRRLFVMHFRARRAGAAGRAVVFFAPFAEEMNRSRRMSTLLAEALAPLGIDLVLFDYSGTGDSDGDFADARWEQWLEDGAAVIDRAAAETGAAVTVLGLRLGAALALQVARANPARIDRAVLWQPVLAGSAFFTQFLRLRVAAALMGGSEKETTHSLRQRLAGGEALEIAGYTIDPALAKAIDGLAGPALAPPPSLPVDWMELAGEGGDIAPAARRIIDGWTAAGIRVRTTAATGELFWTTQETTIAPALIEATVARLRGGPP